MRENAGKWESASARDLERIDAVAQAIVNRLLHEPTARLKETRDDRMHARMATIRELFGLTVEESSYAGVAESHPPEQLAEVRTLDRSARARRS